MIKDSNEILATTTYLWKTGSYSFIYEQQLIMKTHYWGLISIKDILNISITFSVWGRKQNTFS